MEPKIRLVRSFPVHYTKSIIIMLRIIPYHVRYYHALEPFVHYVPFYMDNSSDILQVDTALGSALGRYVHTNIE